MSHARPAIFITGAGQGIGRATALRFAKAGWYVGLYDVNAEAVAALRDEIGAERAHALPLDVRDPLQWEAALGAFWDASGGRLDVLLNNAGIATSGYFEDIPLATHHQIVDVNLKGVINGCHAGVSYLRRTPGSALINLASASAIYGAADLASYSATKFAVRGLTEALDLEWRSSHIRVRDIWPLFVRTKMVEKFEIRSMKSLGVRLTPEDVAATIWKAATSQSRKVHWLVGAQTFGMYWSVCWLPDWLHRPVTGWLSGR